ncbi:MAG: hypothetical protein ACPG4A_13495, partial [Pseudomonadales bacterium]
MSSYLVSDQKRPAISVSLKWTGSSALSRSKYSSQRFSLNSLGLTGKISSIGTSAAGGMGVAPPRCCAGSETVLHRQRGDGGAAAPNAVL